MQKFNMFRNKFKIRKLLGFKDLGFAKYLECSSLFIMS